MAELPNETCEQLGVSVWNQNTRALCVDPISITISYITPFTQRKERVNVLILRQITFIRYSHGQDVSEVFIFK